MTTANPATPPASDVPAHRYDARLADVIERKWQDEWDARGAYTVPNPGEPGFDPGRPKFYVLDMFPYPSGAGLHVGHPEGYTATDILSRYKRMTGHNVLHPMGWDAFGLPAEQYAIQTGIHPAKTTRKSIDTFRRQLKRFGFSYDWSREFGTIDEDYYRWTQWIFLKLYHAWFDPAANRARPIADLIAAAESGAVATPAPWASMPPAQRDAFIDAHRLAYLNEQVVNWCPKLGTVLANDEVIDGRSERGGYPVLRKPLKQWVFRITALADRLAAQLDLLDWPDSTKAMQREWIGRSEGAEIDFPILVRRLSEPTPALVRRLSEPTLSVSHPPSPIFDSDTPIPCRAEGFIPRDPYPPAQPKPIDLIEQVRNLPHIELPGATYFVTWNTKGGLALSEAARGIVMRALLHFDADRCDVYAACVMPTHVHWIVKPREGQSIRDLTASIKRFSATTINHAESSSGSLWQEDAFDHVVRDEKWLSHFLRYVARNPVEAKIVERTADYAWTYIAPTVRTPDGAPAALGSVWSDRGPAEENTVGSESRPTLRVFTTRPDTLFGATYMVLAPEHPLCAAVLNGSIPADPAARDALRAYVAAAASRSDVERQESKQKTGVFTGLHAINPATNTPIPVWAADYVLMGYGTGAIMAVPSGDERDWEFAKAFNLPIIPVVKPADPKAAIDADACFSGDGVAINSSSPDLSLDGLPTPHAKAKVIDWLERTGRGTRKINYRLRDWVFSRQRYWGEPFPIVYDAAGKPYPVMESALPVKLPELADYAPVESDDPQPLLAKATSWVNTTAGRAGVDPALLPPDTPVRRETNTMPGSAGSSWYAIRYCDPRNASRFVGRDAESYWMGSPGTSALQADSSRGTSALRADSSLGTSALRADSPSPSPLGGVDFYIGGSEHAVGHLLYARFWQNVLFDLGEVSTPEPFKKLFHQGMITSFAYQRPDKSLVPADQVREDGEGPDGKPRYVEIATGAPVVAIVAKMSKSLKNVINPDDVIAEFGADTFRLYEMYMGPLEASKPWNPRDIAGCFRFLQRFWRLIVNEDTGALKLAAEPDPKAEALLHRATAKVASDIERQGFNTAIAALMELVNALTPSGGATAAGVLARAQVERLALILSPLAPHLAEELWNKLGHDDLIALAAWPAADPALLRDSEVEIPVQVQGKVRARLTVAADTAPAAIEQAALADPKVVEFLAGRPVKKVIVVPGKMVNIVV